MRNIFAFLLVFLLLISCETKNEPILEEETFSLVGIEFFAREDSREVFTRDIPTITFFNVNSTEIPYTFNPFAGFVEESSFFQSDDIVSFHMDIETFVPVYIDESGTIFLGDRKWQYSRNRQRQTSARNFYTTVIVPENTGIVIGATLFHNQYRADYKLTLRGDQTGKEKIVEGVWTGEYADYAQINITQFDW